MRAYFFGCARGIGYHTQAGHGYYAPGVAAQAREAYDVVPWGTGIDGALAPREWPSRYAPECPQGVAALHHRDGWTALAFWDRTGDSRPGSSSVFVLEREDATFRDMLRMAADRFPDVLARLPFPITPAAALGDNERP